MINLEAVSMFEDFGGGAVNDLGLGPLAYWNCGLESLLGNGCLSLVSVCFVKLSSRRRTDHSSRGVLQSEVYLSGSKDLTEEV
jgi:hypothetical protein